MANRREVIQAGLATCITVAAARVLPAPAAESSVLGFHKVLYDERTLPGAAFAAQARRQGAEVRGVAGDVTNVWLRELQPRWRTHRSPVAGLTDVYSHFVLDLMAQEAGMRTVYTGHHMPDRMGHSHRLFGPGDIAKRSLHSDPSLWARQLANMMLCFPSDEVSVCRSKSNLLAARNHDLGHDSLVSWIIAPVGRG